jgi:hypothetical protein
MRSRSLRWFGGRATFALLAFAFLTALAPHAVRADDVVLMEPPTMVTSGAQQAGPTGSTAGPAPAQFAPQLVENPINNAGGEDDATRAYQQQEQRRQDDGDGGDHRRK